MEEEKKKMTKKLVIVGGGIMGICTAYYARKISPELEIVIVDVEGISKGASGKAGGFLARSWATGELKPLAEKGFHYFPQLAEVYGEKQIQYRRINSISANVIRTKVKKSPVDGVSHRHQKKHQRDVFNNIFVPDKIQAGQMLGNTDSTAQVTPWLLCQLMFKDSGATLVQGEIVGVNYDQQDEHHINSILIKRNLTEDEKKEYEESIDKVKIPDHKIDTVLGDEFCFCLGVWTSVLRRFKLLVPHSMGRRVHAVIVKARDDLLPALEYMNMGIFTDFNNTEMIIREGGVIYVNGSEKGYSRVNLKPHEIHPDEKACKKILGFWEYLTAKPKNSTHGKMMMHDLVEVDDNRKTQEHKKENEKFPVTESGTRIIKKVACHLPMVQHEYKGEQLPVMSRIPRTTNGYVCAGHTCWGILLGPLCGEIMAELILNDAPDKVIDTAPFRLKEPVKANLNGRAASNRKSKGIVFV